MRRALQKENLNGPACGGSYGAFSYGRSQIDHVYKYIFNQKKRHAKQSFKTEYISLLNLFEIDFKDEYLFEFYD
jgi:hypothetical protein